jgi:hypothetical protein
MSVEEPDETTAELDALLSSEHIHKTALDVLADSTAYLNNVQNKARAGELKEQPGQPVRGRSSHGGGAGEFADEDALGAAAGALGVGDELGAEEHLPSSAAPQKAKAHGVSHFFHRKPEAPAPDTAPRRTRPLVVVQNGDEEACVQYCRLMLLLKEQRVERDQLPPRLTWTPETPLGPTLFAIPVSIGTYVKSEPRLEEADEWWTIEPPASLHKASAKTAAVMKYITARMGLGSIINRHPKRGRRKRMLHFRAGMVPAEASGQFLKENDVASEWGVEATEKLHKQLVLTCNMMLEAELGANPHIWEKYYVPKPLPVPPPPPVVQIERLSCSPAAGPFPRPDTLVLTWPARPDVGGVLRREARQARAEAGEAGVESDSDASSSDEDERGRLLTKKEKATQRRQREFRKKLRGGGAAPVGCGCGCRCNFGTAVVAYQVHYRCSSRKERLRMKLLLAKRCPMLPADDSTGGGGGGGNGKGKAMKGTPEAALEEAVAEASHAADGFCSSSSDDEDADIGGHGAGEHRGDDDGRKWSVWPCESDGAERKAHDGHPRLAPLAKGEWPGTSPMVGKGAGSENARQPTQQVQLSICIGTGEPEFCGRASSCWWHLPPRPPTPPLPPPPPAPPAV